MALTRKKRRTIMIVGGLAVIGIAVAIIASSLRDTIVFFYTPSEVAEKGIGTDTRFRLGGLVEEGSVVRGLGTTVSFAITDTAQTLQVKFTGNLPDLFREGQGVVTEGKLDGTGTFIADNVLAKHDENYMPKEVADSLKKQGLWKEP
ncbi:Cytochrome c-type biogenesis protein CcmE, heme chaperone [hydrothermal vent metagenome]|uniref:Cytochrome c-type biogenesis protein CcmE, heme chaperone n=1 Tax=hydrothermal vent metagenome TaxID=652676 RepID=A0A3B0S0B1_9ZZZZ